LSASTASAPLPLCSQQPNASGTIGNLVFPYIPPHPTQGSGAHRIVAFVLEQSSQNDKALAAFLQSSKFSRQTKIWDIVKKGKLTPRGMHVWKSQWDPSVTQVYSNVLQQTEPKYILPPKFAFSEGFGLAANKYGAL
jgi:hypothetical protein